MNDYRTITNMLKYNPNLIEDIVKLNNLSRNISEMTDYELENYFKQQELNRNTDDMVDGIQNIQLFKWIFEQGSKHGNYIKFETFLKELINDDITLDCEFRDDIMDSYSNALEVCNDIEDEDKIIERICTCDMQDISDYINKKEK